VEVCAHTTSLRNVTYTKGVIGSRKSKKDRQIKGIGNIKLKSIMFTSVLSMGRAGVIEPFFPHSQFPPPEKWLGGKTTTGAL
jgi:hypothetical protein